MTLCSEAVSSAIQLLLRLVAVQQNVRKSLQGRLHLLATTQDAGEIPVQNLHQHKMQALAMSQQVYFQGAFVPVQLSAAYGC